MKKVIETSIIIQSRIEDIWELLTAFNQYAIWNPFIISIKGKLNKNEKLEVVIHPPNSSSMKFKPTLIELKPNQELSWKGKLFIPGIFDGEHRFELELLTDGKILFKQSEIFSGVLVPFMNLNNVKKGFEAMNNKMKEILEEKAKIKELIPIE